MKHDPNFPKVALTRVLVGDNALLAMVSPQGMPTRYLALPMPALEFYYGNLENAFAFLYQNSDGCILSDDYLYDTDAVWGWFVNGGYENAAK